MYIYPPALLADIFFKGVCLLISLILAYVVGAIPTGYLLCRMIKGVDVRGCGSGNIGATNVSRVLGKKYFLLVFFLDAGKAWLTLYACDVFFFNAYGGRLIALFLVAGVLLLGNAFSCFLHFKGGKGVATSFGVLGYLFPPMIVLLFASLWFVILFLTKQAFIASMGSMMAVCCVGAFVYQFDAQRLIFLCLVCVWLMARHYGNVKKWWICKI